MKTKMLHSQKTTDLFAHLKTSDGSLLSCRERRVVFEEAPETPTAAEAAAAAAEAPVTPAPEATPATAGEEADAARKVAATAFVNTIDAVTSVADGSPEAKVVVDDTVGQAKQAEQEHSEEVQAAVKDFRETLGRIGTAGNKNQNIEQVLSERPQSFRQFLNANPKAALKFAEQHKDVVDALIADGKNSELSQALTEARSQEKAGDQAEIDSRKLSKDQSDAAKELADEMDKAEAEDEQKGLAEKTFQEALKGLTDLEDPREKQQELAEAFAKAGVDLPAINTVLAQRKLEIDDEITPDQKEKLERSLDAIQNSAIGANIAAYRGAGEVAARIRHPELTKEVGEIESLGEEEKRNVKAKGGDPEVAKLQIALNKKREENGQEPIPVDGLYGQYTREAEKLATDDLPKAEAEPAALELKDILGEGVQSSSDGRSLIQVDGVPNILTEIEDKGGFKVYLQEDDFSDKEIKLNGGESLNFKGTPQDKLLALRAVYAALIGREKTPVASSAIQAFNIGNNRVTSHTTIQEVMEYVAKERAAN
jgi:hypothetical protein